jgi:hypothetical protein
MRAHWIFPFERLYGAMMLATRHSNRSSVTQSIVNAVPLLYSDSKESAVERQFKTTTDFHPFLLQQDPGLELFVREGFSFKSYVIDDQDQTWRAGNFVCVVRANDSTDEHCVFVIVAVMQKCPSIISELEEIEPSATMLLILRPVCLKWLRIGPRLAEKLLSLPMDYADSLGVQSGLLLNDPRSLSQVHICGLVEYQFQERPKYVIPFCGMVNFRVEE